MAEAYEKIGNSTLLRTWGNNPPVGNVVVPPSTLFETGWVGGQEPPAEWMNYVDQQLGEKINHVLQNGGSKWNNTTAYLVGNVVQHSNSVWLCLVNNTNSAPTDVNTNWSKVLTFGTLPAYPTLNSLLPSQTGNSGKVLTTNGTNASWGNVPFASVNFDGTTASNLPSGVNTLTATRASNVVTLVGSEAHGHIVGHRVYIDFASGITDGWFTVASVVSSTSFTVASTGADVASPVNAVLQRRSIRKSTNVQSVIYASPGIYAVNFIAFASDANYNLAGTHSTPGAAPCVFIGHFNGGGTTAPTTGYFHFSADRFGIGGTDTVYNHISVFA
jgi:hypothetical protein